MIVIDANIVVSAVLGVQTQVQLARLVSAGVVLAIPAPQIAEAVKVLTGKMGYSLERARFAAAQVQENMRLLEPAAYEKLEHAARARLHERAQSDWPVLAAALAFDGAVWSNDRDFFGIGVPLWSTRNVHLAGSLAPSP